MDKEFAIDADEGLRAVLSGAEPGEQVSLTVGGKVVARLTATEPSPRIVDAGAVLEHIRQIRKGQSLGGLSLKSLIEEGRMQ